MEALASDAWYVLKTKPRQDERAIQSLDNQGFEVFGPTLNVKKVSRGKRTTRTRETILQSERARVEITRN